MNSKMKKSLSKKELEVLQRIVEAEASGEDLYGKILVANVVINRMNSEEFPDTVSDVVFQREGNCYQFSPTNDGRYYTVKVSKSTKEAVKRALSGEDYSKGALYFFARRLTTEKKASWFDNSLRKVVQYGCHEFYADR
jgi:N-acetylmuramoyl-L-alanine amidase